MTTRMTMRAITIRLRHTIIRGGEEEGAWDNLGVRPTKVDMRPAGCMVITGDMRNMTMRTTKTMKVITKITTQCVAEGPDISCSFESASTAVRRKWLHNIFKIQSVCFGQWR